MGLGRKEYEKPEPTRPHPPRCRSPVVVSNSALRGATQRQRLPLESSRIHAQRERSYTSHFTLRLCVLFRVVSSTPPCFAVHTASTHSSHRGSRSPCGRRCPSAHARVPLQRHRLRRRVRACPYRIEAFRVARDEISQAIRHGNGWFVPGAVRVTK